MRVLLIVAAACLASPLAAETLTGEPEVIDGDTLRIGQRTVRLVGIDAPELDQTCDRQGAPWGCGEESARQLRGIVAGQPVFCTGFEVDQHARLLAQCSNRLGNINKLMVEHGWAVAFRIYSDAFVADEVRARADRRGLWASTFTMPWDHRMLGSAPAMTQDDPAPRRAAPPPSNLRSPGCRIKGNRSRRGEWIYHLPGMPYYEETRAEEYFCSEAEARAAGYRRSRAR